MKRLSASIALALLLSAAGGRPAAAAEPLVSLLDGNYDRWLLAVSHLIAEEERRAFAELPSDLARELFIRRFWRARGGEESGLLERWRDNLDEARRRFGGLEEDRARALLVAGKPAAVTRLRGCREVVRFLEIWSYEPWHAAYQAGVPPSGAAPGDRIPEDDAGGGFRLLFYRESNLRDGAYRHWSRRDGTEALLYGGERSEPWTASRLVDYATAHGCFDRPGDAEALAAALDAALDAVELAARLAAPAPDPGWLAELAAAPPALAAGPAEILFPGRYQQKTILHGRVRVPAREVARNAEGLLFDRLTVVGDVRLGGAAGRLVDAFEVVHHVAGAEPADGLVALDFYRRLRPGTYTLDLRAEDAYGRGLARETRTVEVPRLEAVAEPPAGRENGFAALTRSRVGVLTTFPSVELLPIADDLPVGEVEIVAVTAGGPIERVDFLLDGAPAGSDGEPPFAVDLDLGREPRPRTVAAVAFDPAGREIARDRLDLAPSSRRFAVRLIEPRRGDGPAGSARAVVEVPAGEDLERLELYLGEERFATLREPPWSHPLPPVPAPRGRAVYVRAVAHLAGGGSTEDVVVVSSPDPLEEIDVRLVELYATVVDGRGRPVTGLAADAFRVLEDGVEQPVRRFAPVESLAINVALLMDVSGSMRGRVTMATQSAQRFFDTVLRARDLASLLTFNHDIRRVVPWTADALRLRYGADGFRAFGTTRLHDSLVYAVHSFGGLEGRRALVLLSDGQDVDSDFRFKQVLESTLRSGIAVYPILLDLDDEETRANLVELAGETGGNCFSIHAVAELDAVYRRIERELRSQYLLVYEAPAGGRGDFRRIEVEVEGDGLEARTIRGYYP